MKRSASGAFKLLLSFLLSIYSSDAALAGASVDSLSWTNRSSGIATNLHAVAYSTPSIWVDVGDAGTIIRSTDGGDTWAGVSNPTGDVLYGVAFHGPAGIAVGLGGRSQGPGAGEAGARGSQPASARPDDRPVGRGLAGGLGARNTRLVVYDVLGREVAVLVNETKSAGNYQVSLDGSRLASGTYIYRLTAGSYVQTRRMLLIK